MSPLDTQQILCTIAAMRHQEDTSYSPEGFNDIKDCTLHIDPKRRSKMVAWCREVVAFCKFQSESVEIAMSLVDRSVVAEPAALQEHTQYQLACLTALYITVKIHEHVRIHPSVMSQLTHGAFSTSEIEAMERQLLKTLGWRVCPPTTYGFAQFFVALLDHSFMNEQQRSTALRLTLLQCELAVANNTLVAVPASAIAYAAFLNALRSSGIGLALVEVDTTTLLHRRALGKKYCSAKLGRVRSCLLQAWREERDGAAALQHRKPLREPFTLHRQLDRYVTSESSPRSVVAVERR